MNTFKKRLEVIAERLKQNNVRYHVTYTDGRHESLRLLELLDKIEEWDTISKVDEVPEINNNLVKMLIESWCSDEELCEVVS